MSISYSAWKARARPSRRSRKGPGGKARPSSSSASSTVRSSIVLLDVRPTSRSWLESRSAELPCLLDCVGKADQGTLRVFQACPPPSLRNRVQRCADATVQRLRRCHMAFHELNVDVPCLKAWVG